MGFLVSTSPELADHRSLLSPLGPGSLASPMDFPSPWVRVDVGQFLLFPIHSHRCIRVPRPPALDPAPPTALTLEIHSGARPFSPCL